MAMDLNKSDLPENFGTVTADDEAIGLKAYGIEKANYRCTLKEGGRCGLGVQVYLQNSDPSHNYNVTLNQYTNGSYIQQHVVGVSAGGTVSLGCSQALSYSYTWEVVGEVAY